MIETATTFILGAGASCDYDYPLGYKLMSYLWKSIPGDGWIGKLIEAKGIDRPTRQQFARHLHDCGLASIDDFLERRSDPDKELGKFAIAAALLEKESIRNLQRSHEGPGWFDYIYNKMADGAATDSFLISENKVRFVTFNYDRSLEFLFLRAIRGTYGLEDAKAWKVVKSIPIVHVHGILYGSASETFQYDGNEIATGVGEMGYRVGKVQKAAQGISLMDEVLETSNDNPYARARGYLIGSGRAVFLGFGYHKGNIERLKTKRAIGAPGTELFGTAFELKTAEVHQAAMAIGSQGIKTGNLNCLDLLKEKVIL